MNSRQYTIRSVPARVDRELRKRAKAEGKSLNAVVVDILEHAVAPNGQPVIHHDLDFLFGSWVEDPGFDAAIKHFEEIDEEYWK
jgi:hypothetical protein